MEGTAKWAQAQLTQRLQFLSTSTSLVLTRAGDKHEGLKTTGRGGQEDAPDSSVGRDISERTSK